MFNKPYNELTEIEKVERDIFVLECKEHWTNADFAKSYELYNKLAELKRKSA